MKCLLSGLLLCCFTTIAQVNIIPQPVSVKLSGAKEKFMLGPATQIILEGSGLENSIDFFNSYLKTYYGFSLETASSAKGNNNLTLNFERMDDPIPGAYHLSVDKKGIYIAGDNETGVFYAIQSLIQLLPMPSAEHQLSIPYVEINDRARFAYRGLMLDVGRHIMPVTFVKKFIDYLAMHKMNEFHWHLTEDQGWRIEIKKYPRLTEVGAWRDGTVIGKRPWKENDNIRYGGFYTQDEVRDIVAYAAKRYITVIPEIEMPGHGSAAIAAYPWLSCFPDEKTNIPDSILSEVGRKAKGKLVYEKWGVAEDVFCAGNDSVFTFLQDVIDEIIPLFPSQYIHVGGDECPKTNWKRCPRCQKRIHDLGLKDEHELQSYFIQRMEKYINSKGKTLIGWDEILEGGLAPKAVVMSWRGEKGGIEAAKQKHTVIMTPTTYVYLDYAQGKQEDSLIIGGYLPLEKVYRYEPVPTVLSAADGRYILGAQANIWTEYMTNPSKIEYMIFPRVDALSEVLWSPKSAKNWMDFKRRLPFQFERYHLWDTHYFSDSSQYNMQ